MWALCIEDMACIANPENSQALLPSSEFFDFAFGERLEDFFLVAAKLKGVHGELRWVFSKIEGLVFRVFFSNFHLLKPIP